MQRLHRQARASGALALVDKDLQKFPVEVCYLLDDLQDGEKIWECVELSKLDLSHNRLGSRSLYC